MSNIRFITKNLLKNDDVTMASIESGLEDNYNISSNTTTDTTGKYLVHLDIVAIPPPTKDDYNWVYNETKQELIKSLGYDDTGLILKFDDSRVLLWDINDSLTVWNNSEKEEFPVENLTLVSRYRKLQTKNPKDNEIRITSDSNMSISTIVLARHLFTKQTKVEISLYSEKNWTTLLESKTIILGDTLAVSDIWEWGEFFWGYIPWAGDKIIDDIKKLSSLVFWFDQLHTNVKSIKIIFSPDVCTEVNLFCNEGTITCDDTDTYIAGCNAESLIPLYCNNTVIYCNNTDIYCNAIQYSSGGAAGAASGLSYYEIGYLLAGDYMSPTYNLSPKHSLEWTENTTQYRPESGTLQSDITTPNKRIEFSLNTIPESDRITLHEELINLGLNTEFFISIFPENSNYDKEADYSGIMKMTKIPKYTEFLPNYYNSKFTMEEV